MPRCSSSHLVLLLCCLLSIIIPSNAWTLPATPSSSHRRPLHMSSAAASGASTTKSVLFVCLGNICRSPSVSYNCGQARKARSVVCRSPHAHAHPHHPSHPDPHRPKPSSRVSWKRMAKVWKAVRCSVVVCPGLVCMFACPSCRPARASPQNLPTPSCRRYAAISTTHLLTHNTHIRFLVYAGRSLLPKTILTQTIPPMHLHLPTLTPTHPLFYSSVAIPHRQLRDRRGQPRLVPKGWLQLSSRRQGRQPHASRRFQTRD